MFLEVLVPAGQHHWVYIGGIKFGDFLLVQSVPHTLVSNMNFLPEQRVEFQTLHSLETVQVYYLKYQYQLAGTKGFNIGEIKFGDFLLDSQIAKLKISSNIPAVL